MELFKFINHPGKWIYSLITNILVEINTSAMAVSSLQRWMFKCTIISLFKSFVWYITYPIVPRNRNLNMRRYIAFLFIPLNLRSEISPWMTGFHTTRSMHPLIEAISRSNGLVVLPFDLMICDVLLVLNFILENHLLFFPHYHLKIMLDGLRMKYYKTTSLKCPSFF